jgi:hypothetical protein
MGNLRFSFLCEIEKTPAENEKKTTQMMRNLDVNDGDLIDVNSVTLPRASFVWHILCALCALCSVLCCANVR